MFWLWAKAEKYKSDIRAMLYMWSLRCHMPGECSYSSRDPTEKFEDLPVIKISPESMRILLLSRRSIRAFKEKSVPKELIEQLIEVGIHAGTSSNGQTENFVVIQDRKLLSELEKMVIEIMWDKGMRYLGSEIGQKLAKTRLAMKW